MIEFFAVGYVAIGLGHAFTLWWMHRLVDMKYDDVEGSPYTALECFHGIFLWPCFVFCMATEDDE